MKEMSEAVIIGITSATTILTIVLGRIRCIFRPCSDGPCFQSACSDVPLERKDEHEIDLQQCDLGNGRTAWVLSAKE